MNGIPFSILVVEDDADDRLILDEAFKQIGYEAEIKKFISGEEMLLYLEKIDATLYPSLIILDNTLPKLDASEILSILKKNPLYKNIPVVIYTTAISPRKKESLLALGAYACLKKGTFMSDVVMMARELKSLAESTANKNGLAPHEKP
jgi:CheY-like chemotaxis protein